MGQLSIKKSILTKLIYSFDETPVKILPEYFEEFDSLTMTFKWKNNGG